MSSLRCTERSPAFTLVAAVVALLVALVLGAAVADLARTELTISRHRRATASALAALDACAATVAARLPLGWSFDATLVGVDGVHGTSDDGQLPTPAGCTGLAAAAPGPTTPPRLPATLEAEHAGGRRRAEVVFERAATPGPPALVWLADAGRAGWVSGLLAFNGWASIAAPADPSILDTWLLAQGTTVTSTAGTEPPIWAPGPPLADVVAAAGSAPWVPPSIGLSGGPPPALTLTFSPTGLILTTDRWGAGALVVDGRLDVRAGFTFRGLIVATGGIRVDPAADLELDGALWLGADNPDALAIQGIARLRAQASALRDAAALLSLPHRAMIGAARDF